MGSSIGSLLRSNFNNLLGQHPLFVGCRVISSYRRNDHLGDLLVRARLPSLVAPTGRGPRSIALVSLKFIQNRLTRSWYSITQRFTTTSCNCVYLIFCNVCSTRLVGETGMSLGTRLHQHTVDICNYKDVDSPVIQHFLLHGLGAMRMAGLQSNNTWTPQQRRTAEGCWIHLLDATPVRLS